MKKCIAIISCLFLLKISTVISQTTTYTTQDILNAYPEFFSLNIDYKEDEENYDVSIGLNKLPDAHIMSEMLQKYDAAIYFWHLNASDLTQPENWKIFQQRVIDLSDDSMALRKAFYHEMKHDQQFNKYFLSLTKYYLQSKGSDISDFTPIPWVNITEEQLMAISSRFFYASHINSKGRVSVYICTGTNGHQDMAIDFDPNLIFAFCIQNISRAKHLGYKIYDPLNEEMKKLYEESSQMEGDEKVHFFRYRIYKTMQEAEGLKELIMNQHKEIGHLFGFSVI